MESDWIYSCAVALLCLSLYCLDVKQRKSLVTWVHWRWEPYPSPRPSFPRPLPSPLLFSLSCFLFRSIALRSFTRRSACNECGPADVRTAFTVLLCSSSGGFGGSAVNYQWKSAWRRGTCGMFYCAVTVSHIQAHLFSIITPVNSQCSCQSHAHIVTVIVTVTLQRNLRMSYYGVLMLVWCVWQH